MVVLWALALVGGLWLTIGASQRSLEAARELSHRMGLSPFIIGMTVVAFGTDLPEIANSITASATGHGDVNVGDSIGSAVTQVTLVLGLLCLFNRVPADRRFVGVAGPVTVAALLVGVVLLRDEQLSRADGLLLISLWVPGTWIVQRYGHMVSARQESMFKRGVWTSLRMLASGMAVVAAGALLAVWGFTEIADWLGVPEYATSFLALSLGTSLPELAIDGRALRSGDHSLALGGLIGSSFADATMSLGIGPALFPVAVSASTAGGSLIAAGVVAVAVIVLLSRPSHGRPSGVALIAAYLSAYLVLLT